MMTKRICIFMGRYSVGGVATFTKEYVRILEKNGWEVVLVAGRPSAGESEATGLPEPIYIRGFRRSIVPFFDLVAFLSFLTVLYRLRPQVLMTQTAKAGVIGRISGWIMGVPLVIQVFQGHVLKDFYGPNISWLFSLIERFTSYFCHKIILPKGSDVDLFADVLKIAPRSKLGVLPPAMSVGEIAPPLSESTKLLNERRQFRENYKLLEGECAVLMIGRLAKVKNVDFAFRVIEKSLSDFDGSIRLFVVGSGPEEVPLKHLLKTLNLESRVHMLGTLNDFNELICGCDVFLHTSKHEGHGIVVIQAMMSGLPVLSSDQGFVTELPCRTSRVLELNSPVDQWSTSLRSLYLIGRATSREIAELRRNYDRIFRPNDLEHDLLDLVNGREIEFRNYENR